uniref:Uncharacterized protein n=1 Tax=Pseudomonas phage HRDY3 TaxID=3236930 RepID=A0AB39CDT1_9VIRU
MNVNPFAVATSLVGKLTSYNIDYTITSGNLLNLPKDKPSCVQLEITTSKARVVIRIFANCFVEVDQLENKDSKALWSIMEIFLKTILGPASAGYLIHHG